MGGDVVEFARVTCHLPLVAYRVYAQSVSMKNSPLNTSLRSATHATDSTRNGWIANTAATNALRQEVWGPVHQPQHQKKQDRRRRMEQDIGEMMAAGIQPI